MLGFAPLASIPLASAPNTLAPIYVNLSTQLDGKPIGLLLCLTRGEADGLIFGGGPTLTNGLLNRAVGSITFGGNAGLSAGGSILLETSGPIRLGGSATAIIDIYTSSMGTQIRFGGHPLLRLAGRPIVITALPESMTVSAEKVSYDFTALPDNLTLRWQ